MNYSESSLSNKYYDALIGVMAKEHLENNKNMAEQIRGTIQRVPDPREFKKGSQVTYYYSFKLNDVYYSNGTKKPPAEGTLVEFEAEVNDKGYWNVTKAGLKIVQASEPTQRVSAGAVTAAQSGKMSKDDYWSRKEDRDLEWQNYQRTVIQRKIELQAARNAAIEFVKLLLIPVGVDKEGLPVVALKLGAQNKREQILAEAVEKYTQEFVSQNNNNETINNNDDQQKDEPAREPDPAVADDDSAWN